MDIGPCLLIWFIGFMTGWAAGKIVNRSYRKQAIAVLDQAKTIRDETNKSLDRISALGNEITIKHDNMMKMAASISRFEQAVQDTKPPDWNQEKKKLPDQL
jgi:uncharacterized protein YoxC